MYPKHVTYHQSGRKRTHLHYIVLFMNLEFICICIVCIWEVIVTCDVLGHLWRRCDAMQLEQKKKCFKNSSHIELGGCQDNAWGSYSGSTFTFAQYLHTRNHKAPQQMEIKQNNSKQKTKKLGCALLDSAWGCCKKLHAAANLSFARPMALWWWEMRCLDETVSSWGLHWVTAWYVPGSFLGHLSMTLKSQKPNGGLWILNLAVKDQYEWKGVSYIHWS